MRITNAMTTNRLLLNLNRNSRALDRLQMQLSSGKIIQNPSENPIIASRSLRFRTNISETTQHQRNTTQGMSWMQVSDQAMNNKTQVLQQINTLLVQGASDTYQYEDRQKIAAEIEMLFQQLNTEMNGTFAGRYLFSGFRTNHPPIISRPDPDAHMSVAKTIGSNDIARGVLRAWVNPDGTGPHQASVNVVRIPFQNVDSINLPGFNVVSMSLNNTSNPFVFTDDEQADPNMVRFIPETGELIFSDAAAERFIAGEIIPFAPPAPPLMENFGIDAAAFGALFESHMAEFEALAQSIQDQQDWITANEALLCRAVHKDRMLFTDSFFFGHTSCVWHASARVCTLIYTFTRAVA